MNLLFTCDLDPIGVTINEDRNNLNWFQYNNLHDLRDCFTKFKWKMNWFVRADNLIEKYHGDICWQYFEYKNLWDDFTKLGDSLAWHPHLYEYINSQFELFTDEVLEAKHLDNMYKQILKSGLKFKYVRVGEGRGSNQIFNVLEKNDFKADFSAIPGRKRFDKNRIFDWSDASNIAYYPSIDNYQCSSKNNLNLLEVPMTTFKIKADYDDSPKLRYIDLSYRNDLFKKSFPTFLKKNMDIDFIHFVSHPEGLISESFTNGLYDYGLDNLRLNLDYIYSSLSEFEIDFKSLNLDEFCINHELLKYE